MDNWNNIEFIFCHKLNTDALTLRELEFYTIQYILKKYEEYLDKENKEYEKQKRDMDKSQGGMKAATSRTPNFQPPKFDIPKFDIPKF